ncbi:MAG: hypothetical protein AABW99_04135 [archaeon]
MYTYYYLNINDAMVLQEIFGFKGFTSWWGLEKMDWLEFVGENKQVRVPRIKASSLGFAYRRAKSQSKTLLAMANQ